MSVNSLSVNSRRDIWLVGVVFFLAVVLQWLGAFGALERSARDVGFGVLRSTGAHPIANDLVLVAIDDEFLESIAEPFALIHPYLGRLMAGLAQAQPSVVGLDLVLPAKSYREMQSPQVKDYDLALLGGMHALSHVAPIVLAQAWDEPGGRFRPILPSYVTVARRSAKGETKDTTASSVVCEDADSVVRSYPGVGCQPTRAAVPLAARMAAQLGNAQNWSGEINFALGEPMRLIRFAEVLRWLEMGATDTLHTTFSGKAVLIGAAFSYDDRHVLPVPLFAAEPGERKIPGLLLQAQIWRSIMNSGLVLPLSWPLQALFVGSAALAAARRTRPLKILLCSLAIVAMTGVALYCLSALNVWLPWAGWTAMLLLALLMRAGFDLQSLLRHRREMSAAFAGYVGPQVLQAIERGEFKPGLDGEMRRVCVVFATLRSFHLSAASVDRGECYPSITPARLVRLANRFFAVAAPAVQESGGTVTRYFGDGLMALFGAPQSLDDPVRHALEATQEVLLRVAELNRALLEESAGKSAGVSAAEGLPLLQIGFGVHFGDVVLGHMGAAERHEYTAVGPTVDAAAQIEAWGREVVGQTLPGGNTSYPIIVSAAVVTEMGLRAVFDDLGEHSLGACGRIRLYGWQPEALNGAMA
jgi:class 3 adenylate cyclase/CHASE2 domain-containing sensor protein